MGVLRLPHKTMAFLLVSLSKIVPTKKRVPTPHTKDEPSIFFKRRPAHSKPTRNLRPDPGLRHARRARFLIGVLHALFRKEDEQGNQHLKRERCKLGTERTVDPILIKPSLVVRVFLGEMRRVSRHFWPHPNKLGLA